MTQIARLSYRPLLLAAGAAFIAGPAVADMSLRVESRPNTEAIEAFVRVTDGSGPVAGLSAADFAVTLDGAALNTFTLNLPPNQDPTQKVSIVLVATDPLFTGSPITDALVNLIKQMAIGDYAAVIKFKANSSDWTGRPLPARPVALPFTQIDGGAGTDDLIAFLSVPTVSLMHYWYRPVLDGMFLAVDQFAEPAVVLPNGPKAVIQVDIFRDTYSANSQSDVVGYANDKGIPMFTVGVGSIDEHHALNALMASVAEDTGGTYLIASEQAQIGETLVTVVGLLTSAYRLTIPQGAVTDCFPHVLEVTSLGQSESIAFTRCDTTPDDFWFYSQDSVAVGSVVVSDPVKIKGIESPVAIRVIDGEYSIGCGSEFTATEGMIFREQQVCVRHTAAAETDEMTSTLLIVGGVSASFSSTTSATPQAPPPPPPPVAPQPVGSGGSGAAGMLELLFALGFTLCRQSRKTARRTSGTETLIRI